MDFGFDGNICSHGLDVKRRHREDERNRLWQALKLTPASPKSWTGAPKYCPSWLGGAEVHRELCLHCWSKGMGRSHCVQWMHGCAPRKLFPGAVEVELL